MSQTLFSSRTSRIVKSWKIPTKISKKFVTKDYKILLLMFFFWGLPYAPCQLVGCSDTTNKLLTVFSFLYTASKMSVSLFSICYTGTALPTTSLVISYNAFVVFCLLINACLFIKRRKILEVTKLVISVMNQISPRNFKSRWNVVAILAITLPANVAVFTTVTFVNEKIFASLNTTKPLFFLWYDMTEVDVFRKVLWITSTFTFSDCAGFGTAAILFATTTYYHMGDIVTNFGVQLLKRFEYHQSMDQRCLLENLRMLQQITSLNKSLNEAFSTLNLLIYAGLMSVCFLGVSALRSFSNMDSMLGALILILFWVTLLCFVCVTIVGDRVIKKDKELKEFVVAHAARLLVLHSDVKDRMIAWFSILSTEIRSAHFHVTGGGMFIINNSLMLTVTGTLITYGVLISQLD